jgi:predicted ATPase
VHERTGGNPFYLEEVCRTLREAGAVRLEDGEARVVGTLDGLQIPESVQAVIRTRLDRIEPRARDVLRRASVIGREFSLRVLERAADDVTDLFDLLQLLKERGLVRQARVVPEPVFRFQHALTQEVAYDSLLQRQRKDLHGRVGEAIEHVHGESREEYYDVLARHFAEAERWDRAVRYGQLSAHRARSLSQFVDALNALEKTREWLGHLPDSEATRECWIGLLMEEALAWEVVGDLKRQQQAVDALLDLLKNEKDRPELVRAYLIRAEGQAMARDFDAGQRTLELALAARLSTGPSRSIDDRGTCTASWAT